MRSHSAGSLLIARYAVSIHGLRAPEAHDCVLGGAIGRLRVVVVHLLTVAGDARGDRGDANHRPKRPMAPRVSRRRPVTML